MFEVFFDLWATPAYETVETAEPSPPLRRLSSAMVAVRPLDRKIDPLACMGSWYVQAAIPTAFDKGAHNGVEEYTWDAASSRVKVKYRCA